MGLFEELLVIRVFYIRGFLELRGGTSVADIALVSVRITRREYTGVF